MATTQPNAEKLSPIWIDQKQRAPDAHVAFRGIFELARDTTIQLHALGASWFVLWLDNDLLLEGPARFIPAHPEYETRELALRAGKHVLTAHVHDEALATRMLPDMPPFLSVMVFANETSIPIRWKAMQLPGFYQQLRRINPQLGWVQWQDTRAEPADWRKLEFDDQAWSDPVSSGRGLGPARPLSIASVRSVDHKLIPIATGTYAEAFGYEHDDPPARFFLRDLAEKGISTFFTGIWRRYDLGRVRLGRPRFVLDVPSGTTIDFAQSEQLRHNRVAPYITLSGGPSCNLDHFTARGGKQEFFPLTPKGGRYLEIHISATPDQVKLIEETFVERTYHGDPEGEFHCDDELLNRIWRTGVETYRACSEDAIIDNPTRERGQWVGDALIGGEIAAVAYSDLRLMRRCLLQTAQCAREDGLVPGMTTGGLIFISTYALLWIVGCIRYYRLTGDKSLLEDLFDAARKNLAAFEPHVHPDGLHDFAGAFVDWGFSQGKNPINLPLNFHYLSALESMSTWSRILGGGDHMHQYSRRTDQIRSILKQHVRDNDLATLGYHSTALALAHSLVDPKPAIAFMKQHILSCFPNNPDAPRLSDPSVRSTQLITPYFAHFAFPPLIEHGEMDFVLDQYRKCWGWALEDNRTTWVEVFDTRWSHCHQWSGCPTWQLSRYVLGLHPQFDLGTNHFVGSPGTELEFAL